MSKDEKLLIGSSKVRLKDFISYCRLKKDWIAFWALVLLAFILRLHNLGNLNLWSDETYSVEVARNNFFNILQMVWIHGDPNPPFNYAFLHFWMQIFGDSEFSVRFPSAIFSSLSVGLIYLVGVRFSSRKVAALASILTLGPHNYIRFGQEARAYALFGFLSLLSILYYPSEMKWESPKKKYFFF